MRALVMHASTGSNYAVSAQMDGLTIHQPACVPHALERGYTAVCQHRRSYTVVECGFLKVYAACYKKYDALSS